MRVALFVTVLVFAPATAFAAGACPAGATLLQTLKASNAATSAYRAYSHTAIGNLDMTALCSAEYFRLADAHIAGLQNVIAGVKPVQDTCAVSDPATVTAANTLLVQSQSIYDSQHVSVEKARKDCGR